MEVVNNIQQRLTVEKQMMLLNNGYNIEIKITQPDWTNFGNNLPHDINPTQRYIDKLIEQRTETAQLYFKLQDSEKKEIVIEYFIKLNDELKKLIGL